MESMLEHKKEEMEKERENYDPTHLSPSLRTLAKSPSVEYLLQVP